METFITKVQKIRDRANKVETMKKKLKIWLTNVRNAVGKWVAVKNHSSLGTTQYPVALLGVCAYRGEYATNLSIRLEGQVHKRVICIDTIE